MAARNSKKKQLVTAFETPKDRVEVIASEFAWVNSETDELDLKGFVVALEAQQSLQGQVKVIQAKKGQFKQIFSNATAESSTALLSSAKILLQLYLRPKFFALRGSLEWVVESLTRNDASISLSALIKEVCTTEWTVIVSLYSQENGLGDVNQLIGVALSLNCMAVLDSQFRWLDDASSEGVTALQDQTFLLRFATYLSGIYTQSAAKLCQSDSDLSTAEVLKYVECCGESMRALMTVIKSRRHCYVPAADSANSASSSQWCKLCEQLLQSSASVLVSELANKDVITFTAMCLVSIQWLLRVPENTAGPAQVSSFVALLSTVTASGSSLHPIVAEAVLNAPLMAKCALVRACLAVHDDSTLHHADAKSLLLGPIFQFIMRVCDHDLPMNRLYGFQTLESWLARLLVIPGATLFSRSTVYDSLVESFREITHVLTSAWSHPSRQVNHLVPNIYTKAVNALHLLQQAHVAVQSEASTVAASQTAGEVLWAALLAEALTMPAHHRGRYQALNMLLPYMGADKILAAQPDIIHLLVSAVGTRDIASAASGFLSSLLGELYAAIRAPEGSVDSASETAVRARWSGEVIRALCQPTNRKLRVHIADYLLPELLKVDATCVPYMVHQIRRLAEAGPGRAELHGKLWGMVNFTLQARLNGLVGQATCSVGTEAESGNGITEQELVLACVSADNELRLVALTALVASSRSAAPMDPLDMKVLRQTLRYSLKNSDADHRHKIARIVKSLFLRLKESCRVSERDIVKLEKQMEFAVTKPAPAGSTTVVASEEATGAKKHKSRKLAQQQQSAMTADECVVAIAEARRVIQDSFEACQWLSAELLDNLYPGASSDREVMSLDLLAAMTDAMGADSAQMQGIYSVYMTRTLINLFISSWDRSRRSAADLLLQFPRPLAGYATPETASSLLQWGLELAGSAKLRESDAGALLVRDIYVIYAADLQWYLSAAVTTTATETSTAVGTPAGKEQCCGAFVSSLCDRWHSALVKLEEVFTAFTLSEILSSNQQYPYQTNAVAASATESTVVAPSSAVATNDPLCAASFPLCHGILLAIRFCLQESQKSGQLGAAFWRPVIQRIYAYALKSLKLAMTIVAEAPSDVPFAPMPISSKGPVNAATAAAAPSNKGMAASYINTNSAMGTGSAGAKKSSSDGEEIDGSGEDAGGATAQRAVVAAWLLVKESCSLLSLLVSVSPAGPVGAPEELLDESEITEAGSLILDALGRLKHMGAISEAQLALQSIATTLLRHGSKSPTLCRLPRQWLDQVLGRLQGEQQQVFILRRSAGFAYSFLSLLRAEPLNCTPTLLPIAMNNLLHTVRVGLEDAQHFTDGTDDDGDFTSKWKLAVHALNVLRLILSDGALGPDLNSYIPETAQLAVRGFTAPQWAVRNSCMMVFTAVAQRAVGTDKNDSAGAAVPTIHEFFQRFPALEPFLVSELRTAIDCMCVNGVPNSTVHPTLYPLLLLIAKLRVAVLPEVVSVAAQDSEDTAATGPSTLQQLVSLVHACTSQRVQAVRVIAAKALRVLTPVSAASAAAVQMLNKLHALLDGVSQSGKHVNARGAVDLNALHGHLLVVRELLKSVSTYVDMNLQSNVDFVTMLRAEVFDTVLPLLQGVVNALGEVRCAPLHLALLESIQFVYKLGGAQYSPAGSKVQHLLVQQARYALPYVYLAGLQGAAASPLPYEPWLWRECVQTLVHQSMDIAVHAAGADAGVLSLQTQCVGEDMVFELLQHPVSEVREGVIKGLLGHLNASVANKSYIEQKKDVFLLQLLKRAELETQPPVAQVTFELFSRIVATAPLSALQPATRAHFRTHGSSVLDTLTSGALQGAASVATSTDGNAVLALQQSSSAQAALEISGWIMADIIAEPTSETSQTSLQRWVSVLESASPAEQSVGLRLSAATSLLHSQLFNSGSVGAVVYSAELVLVHMRASVVALTLLQDDDEDVRDVINGMLVSATASTTTTGAATNTPVLTIPAGFPTTEEFSLQSLSNTISSLLQRAHAHSEAHFQQAVRVVYRAFLDSALGKETQASINAIIHAPNSALSQKIFEAEQDNLYVEPISAGRALVAALLDTLTSVLNGSAASGFATRQSVLSFLADLLSPVLLQAATLFGDLLRGAEGTPTSYQANLFQYFYLCFTLSTTLLQLSGDNDYTGELVSLKEAVKKLNALLSAQDAARATTTVQHPWITTELSRVV